MTGKELLRLMLQGGPGFCQIAVTNACNALCRFCSFPRVAPAEWVMADPARLLRGLKVLRDKGVHYLCSEKLLKLVAQAFQPAPRKQVSRAQPGKAVPPVNTRFSCFTGGPKAHE